MKVVAIIIAVLILIPVTVLIGLCVCCFARRRRVPDDDPELSLSEHAYGIKKRKCSKPMNIAYKKLERATDGFSDSNVIGEGGFGRVYKGVIKNEVVAVKKLKAGSAQGDDQFKAEIEFISRVHHRRFVGLVGYCIHGEQRLLVYEFVPNNSLKVHLHGKPRIVHRDIKSDNILLDDNFEPKLADFGLAKFFPDAVTHVSTDAKGTLGYLDPDYFNTRKLTDKSDVYSYGVVLLELISGRRPVEGDVNIVSWASPRIQEALDRGMCDPLIDPKLRRGGYNFMEMARMIFCAAACVSRSPEDRPQMSQVARALDGTISAECIWKRNES